MEIFQVRRDWHEIFKVIKTRTYNREYFTEQEVCYHQSSIVLQEMLMGLHKEEEEGEGEEKRNIIKRIKWQNKGTYQ